MFAVIPCLIAGVMVAIMEQSFEQGGLARAAQQMQQLENSRQGRQVGNPMGINWEKMTSDPDQGRHYAWAFILYTLFRYPQAFGMIVVVGLVAPRLISYDLRSRGYLLYLSRPLTPGEYIFGKALVLYFLLFMISALPALMIYLTGLVLSPDSTAFFQTWDLPLRILLATMVLMIPTTAIALAFSSVTQESRFAGFAWFALWVLGAVVYQVLWFASTVDLPMGRGGRDVLEDMQNWSVLKLFSPYETLGYMQQQVFGLTSSEQGAWSPWVLALIVSVLGYGVAYWRVSRVLKA
jgi:ABC-type transport system involved in multi-copper enzyme maturation permease subunit